MDLSVVVASHANPQGLYLTVFALIQQLSCLHMDWEIIIAADGGTPTKYENLPNVKCLRIQTGSPQGTRDAGIRAASAATVLVVEDHVIVFDIGRLLEAYKGVNVTRDGRVAMLFPARVAEGSELFNVYGNETDWDGNLWFKRTLYQPKSSEHLYPVPQFGHSCFLLNRQAYLDTGGYTNILIGWGGEEPLLCLKFWMLGWECWQTLYPAHAHFLADRGAGVAMASEQYKKNFDMVEYVIAGRIPERGRLLMLTPQIIAERQRIINGPYGGDLNKLREYFKTQGISN